MTDAPRKPFWKRKRWIAAAVLWLMAPVFNVLSIGAAWGALLRGWIEVETYFAYVGPWNSIAPYLPDGLLILYDDYLDFWMNLVLGPA